MRKFLFTFIFTIVSLSAFANDKNVSESQLIKEIENMTSIQADFTQINEIKDFGKDEYTGSMAIIKGQKALWDYKKPFESWYLFSANKIEFYDKNNNQLMIYETGEQITNILLQLLLDISVAKSKFDITTNKNIITLKPKEDLGVKFLNIEMKNNIISSMESTDNIGNNTKIIFSNVVINKKIDDKIFDKKAPKDAEIFKQKQ